MIIKGRADLEKLDALLGKDVYAYFANEQVHGKLIKVGDEYRIRLGEPFEDVSLNDIENEIIISEEPYETKPRGEEVDIEICLLQHKPQHKYELKQGQKFIITYKGLKKEIKREVYYSGMVEDKYCFIDKMGVRFFLKPDSIIEVEEIKD